MKKQIYAVIIVLVGFFTFSTAQASWTGISSDQAQPAGIELISSNIEESTIHFSLDGFNQVPLETPRGTEMKISVQGGVQIFEKGMPDLGKIVTSIIIPDIDEMQVRIIDAKYVEYRDILVAPSKGHIYRNVNPDDVPFTYGEAYEQDAFWPGELTELSDPFIMRDFRGQSVTVFPFQYNPVSQTLRVYTDIIVEVTSTGREGIEPMVRKRQEIVLEPEFGRVYDRFFLNMQDASKSYPMLEGEEGSLLIIAYDAFMDEMQPFVDWKRTLGRRTEIVPKSEAGANANAIKAFVADYYDNNEDFAYLLLIGDGPQIPPMVTSNGHSDNAYGYLVGNNSFNDIFVGRFSAENTGHVATQVQRSIEYERDLNETDTWLSYGLGIARNEGAGGGHYGEADHVHMDFIRDTLLNFTYDVVYQRYDGPGFSTSAAEITGDINGGVSIINFCNHGSITGWSVAGYNIGHVNNLTNVGKLPWIWSVACVNGNFVSHFCFAEAWLRATHNGQPSGAVGMMASTINQLWQPPMCGQDEMNSILTEESIPLGPTIKRTFGGTSINGSMFMIPQYGSTGIQTHDTWILFGDPTLMLRTEAPSAFNPDYPAVALIGWSSFEVTGLAEHAVAAFTVVNNDGEVEILGTAVAGANGVANIIFDEPLNMPATATLAITGFNKVTYINDDISVIPPSGPYVLLNNFTVEGETVYDETVAFTLEIENVGIHTAENLHIILSSDDDYVNIIEDTYVWGDLPEYESGVNENMFLVHLDKNIPDQHKPHFNVTFVDANEESWYGHFNFTVDAPAYEILSVIVDDSETGNNNGGLDPGEIAHLTITFKNTGHADITNLTASGTPQNDNLVFLDDEVYVGDMAVGDEKTIEITVMGSHLTLPETTEYFSLDLITTDYLNENIIGLVVGLLPEYFMGDDFYVASCYGKFYDSGGPDENYGANDNYIITFYPAHPDDQLHFIFDEFHIEDSNNCEGDFLRVFNGPNTSWPLIGTYCGTNSPGEFTSNNPHGAITFRFRSVTSNTFPGWAARFYCANPELIFENISAYPQNICEGEHAQLSAMSTGGGDHVTFLWSPAESLSDPNIPNPVAFPSETTEYTLEISDGETSVSESITIFVQPAPDVFLGDTIYASYSQPVVLDAGEGDFEYLWSDGSTDRFLTVDYNDYQTDIVHISVIVTNQYGCSSEDDVVIVFQEDGMHTVTFVVHDAHGEPVHNAVITLGDITNDEGNYVFNEVAPGAHPYEIVKHCYITLEGEVMVSGNTTLEVVLDNVPGDANGDGLVNVLDLINTVNYFVGLIPDGFCFNNADVNNDGVINILDVIGISNIFSGGKVSPYDEVQSESASLYLREDGIYLSGDGTVSGIQFELQTEMYQNVGLRTNLPSHELKYAYEDGTIIAMVFSFDNTPIPAGEVLLVSFEQPVNMLSWTSAMAGNINAEEVPLNLYNEAITGVQDVAGLEFKAYPNPADDNIWVEFLNNTGDKHTIALINVHGRIVRQINVHDMGHHQVEFSLGGLASGVYMIRIDHQDGFAVERIVVN